MHMRIGAKGGVVRMLTEEQISDLLVQANNELDELHGSYRYVDAHTYMEGYRDALRRVLSDKPLEKVKSK
jgi:hypothetical protein